MPMKTLLVTLSLILIALAVVPASEAKQTCVVKSGIGACVGDNASGAECVVVGFGLQGGWACVNPTDGTVRICSTLYVYNVGNCPLDAIHLG